MIDIKDLRDGNIINYDGLKSFSYLYYDILEDLIPVKLTREILKNNLGFEVHDMGDYWQCENEDFVLIQPKFLIMPSIEIDYIFAFKTTIGRSIGIKHVHHLQNIYYFTIQKELKWKP